MNQDDLNRAMTEEEVDLLVDGELPEERRAVLLQSLDESDDGWKRVALRFLEAQAWRDAMVDDEVVPAPRRRAWQMPRAAALAAILGFVAALGVRGSSGSELASGTPELEAPRGTVVEDEESPQYLFYPLVQHTGFVPASDELGNRFYRTRGEVPDFFLQALQQAGHDVKHVERTVDVPRPDGEPLRLPITETQVFVNHAL